MLDAVVGEVRGGVRGLDLHAADGVDCVARAAAEAFPVAVQPVEVAREGDEDDVEEGGVVPL